MSALQRKAALLAKQWDFWRREMRVKNEVLMRLRQRADVRDTGSEPEIVLACTSLEVSNCTL